MYGLQACVNSLYMRGVTTPTPEQICDEAYRMMHVRYSCVVNGEPDKEVTLGDDMVAAYADLTGREVFFATRISDDLAACLAFRIGDLVENVVSDAIWKYGVVKRIEWYRTCGDSGCRLIVSIGAGKTTEVYAKALKEKVRLASMPPEILDLAMAQLKEKDNG